MMLVVQPTDERRRQAQLAHHERLPEPLEQCRRGVRMVCLEPRRVCLELGDAIIGRQLAGRLHDRGGLRNALSGQALENVALLVHTVALHVGPFAEKLLDGRAQRFGTIDHRQVLAIRRQAALDQSAQQILVTIWAFSLEPLARPRRCFWPGAVHRRWRR